MQNKFVDVIPLSQQRCQQPIQCQLAYATRENFLGRLVKGYHADAAHICLLERNAAEALCDVQNQLNKMQLGLFVFDSYRPLRAVHDFRDWMQQPPQDAYEIERKTIHYPHLEKNQLSILGYIADDVSNHCFGDTIDLSIIDLRSKQLLNMGACFDYFDEISHPTAKAETIGLEAHQNRLLLANAMLAVGFLPYEKEYWHYTFQHRELQTPEDFEILPALEGLG